MNKKIKGGIYFIFFIFLMNFHLNGQILPSKDTLLKQMIVANKYFMDKWPDPGEDIVTDRSRPSNLWTRATYYEGLMGLYYIARDTIYYKYAVDWGESHEWRPTYDNLRTRNADNQCCGQTYIELYQLDQKPERIEPIKTCIDSMVNDNRNDDWWWIDAIQMAMPVFAKLGVIYNDTSYFRKMHDLYMFSKTEHGENGLYNETEHLWWRDEDFDPPYQTPGGMNCYWSRGNGWVLAALARVLDVVPDSLEFRDAYVTTFKEMAEALIEMQREDGFWNPSLADSNHFGGKETSGTAFFTFGLAWGINNGILDSNVYTPYVIKAWNGMTRDALHRTGFLGYMQGTGKQPSDGQPLSYTKAPNFEDYGLGAFLLAGSEVYHLAPDTGSIPAFPPEEKPEPVKIKTFAFEVESDFKVFQDIYEKKVSFSFSVDNTIEAELKIFNLLGKQIDIIAYGRLVPGNYHYEMEHNNLPKGIYFAVLKINNQVITRKFILY